MQWNLEFLNYNKSTHFDEGEHIFVVGVNGDEGEEEGEGRSNIFNYEQSGLSIDRLMICEVC